MNLVFVLALAVLFVAGALPVASSGQVSRCDASPTHDMLPGVIAPMAGADPVWIVDSGASKWGRADPPIKTVWVLSRRLSGRLTVFGHERNSGNRLQFRRGGEGAFTETLLIEDPLSESMTPGGASAEVMKQFAFVSSYVYFPSSGCWEITSDWGGIRQTISVLR